jgi:hypothetical protein
MSEMVRVYNEIIFPYPGKGKIQLKFNSCKSINYEKQEVSIFNINSTHVFQSSIVNGIPGKGK